MKKRIALLLAALTLFACVGCGAKKEEKDRLAKIREKGYIEMATEPYWAPNEFIDSTKSGDEQYVGMDIELGKAIAEKLGVKLKIVPLEFSAVLAGIVDGKYDMAISALAYSPARAETMAMSKGYFFGDEGYGFMVRAGDEEKWNSIEDAKKAVIVTQSGSVQEGFYKLFIGECKELKLVSSMTDAYLAVAEGKADLCITATTSGQLYAEANGGLAIPTFRFDVTDELTGTRVACPLEDSDSLMEVINQVIDELRAEGTIEGWYEEYTAYAKSLGIE